MTSNQLSKWGDRASTLLWEVFLPVAVLVIIYMSAPQARPVLTITAGWFLGFLILLLLREWDSQSKLVRILYWMWVLPAMVYAVLFYAGFMP